MCDPADWRGPIQAEVQATEVPIVSDAVTFYTGTSIDVTVLRDGLVGVRSVGYRMGPCGP